MRRWASTILFAVLFVGGVAFLWWQQYDQANELVLRNQRFHMTIAQTEAQREKGLSGTNRLGDDQAMLFVFPNDSKWSMWMKDMQYPIDMVWLDSDKNVVYKIENAQPASYPQTQFIPDKNARYVIELASGTIERTGITIGDPAGIPSGL